MNSPVPGNALHSLCFGQWMFDLYWFITLTGLGDLVVCGYCFRRPNPVPDVVLLETQQFVVNKMLVAQNFRNCSGAACGASHFNAKFQCRKTSSKIKEVL